MKEKYVIFLQNIKTFLKACIILFILFSVLYSSSITAYSSHNSFYKKKPNPYVLSFFNTIKKQRQYDLVLSYTGLNTGYGFFSPNVSSDFVITHSIYKNSNEEILFSNSSFESKEGALRFSHINSLFMDKIEAIEDSIHVDSLRLKYLNLILRRMSNIQMDKAVLPLDSVRTSLYLYHYPFLREYPSIKPKFYKIDTYLTEKE